MSKEKENPFSDRGAAYQRLKAIGDIADQVLRDITERDQQLDQFEKTTPPIPYQDANTADLVTEVDRRRERQAYEGDYLTSYEVQLRDRSSKLHNEHRDLVAKFNDERRKVNSLEVEKTEAGKTIASLQKQIDEFEKSIGSMAMREALRLATPYQLIVELEEKRRRVGVGNTQTQLEQNLRGQKDELWTAINKLREKENDRPGWIDPHDHAALVSAVNKLRAHGDHGEHTWREVMLKTEVQELKRQLSEHQLDHFQAGMTAYRIGHAHDDSRKEVRACRKYWKGEVKKWRQEAERWRKGWRSAMQQRDMMMKDLEEIANPKKGDK